MLTVVPAGCPPVVNASEHMTEPPQPPEPAHAAVGAVSIAIPSMPVAPAAKSTRAVVNTALRMMEPPSASADWSGGDALGKHAPPVWTVPARARVVIRPFFDSTLGAQPGGCKLRAQKAANRPVKAAWRRGGGPGAGRSVDHALTSSARELRPWWHAIHDRRNRA